MARPEIVHDLQLRQEGFVAPAWPHVGSTEGILAGGAQSGLGDLSPWPLVAGHEAAGIHLRTPRVWAWNDAENRGIATQI